MALSPIDPIIDAIIDILPIDNGETTEAIPQATKTYSLDFDTGEIGGKVEGDDAIRQFIRKAIVTPRFRHLIYTDQYGSEIDTLFGRDLTPELVEAEIPRFIYEALIYDDRVSDVAIESTGKTGDSVYATITVTLTDGTKVTEEVTV